MKFLADPANLHCKKLRSYIYKIQPFLAIVKFYVSINAPSVFP